MPSRRTFLLGGSASLLTGGLGPVAVDTGILPGRIALRAALGRCDVGTSVPTGEPGRMTYGVLDSVARGRPVAWTLARPPGPHQDDLPVVLVLHGRSGNRRTAFDSIGLLRYLAAHVAGGGRPFALAAADGGDTYWHPRSSGDDPVTMLVAELPPMLAAQGLRTDRVGALGWSMGGYGSLLLARESARAELGGTVVVAAAAASPALFASYADAAPGAFDDAADFARWGNLLDGPGVSPAVALDVRCGDNDVFTDVTLA